MQYNIVNINPVTVLYIAAGYVNIDNAEDLRAGSRD